MSDIVLSFLLFCTFFVNSQGVQIGFRETDSSARESSANIPMFIDKNGVNSGNITIRVTPVTIDQYKERFNLETLSNDIMRILEQRDPAEASDFSSDAQNITFTPGGYHDETVTIAIIDDLIQEPEEVFLVYLEIVQINDEDLRNLELTRNDTVGRIRIDNDRVDVVVNFTQGQYKVQEGNTTRVCVRLEPEGAHVELHLSVFTVPGNATANEYYISISEEMSFSSENQMECVAIETVDNDRAELPHALTVQFEDKYPIDTHPIEPSLVRVVITDDEVVRIGFTHDGNETMVLEGEMIDVCAMILEPNEVIMEIDLLINNTGQGNATENMDYEPFRQELRVSGANRSECITIMTIENLKDELPHVLVITLEAKNPSSQLSIGPSFIPLLIMDASKPPTEEPEYDSPAWNVDIVIPAFFSMAFVIIVIIIMIIVIILLLKTIHKRKKLKTIHKRKKMKTIHKRKKMKTIHKRKKMRKSFSPDEEKLLEETSLSVDHLDRQHVQPNESHELRLSTLHLTIDTNDIPESSNATITDCTDFRNTEIEKYKCDKMPDVEEMVPFVDQVDVLRYDLQSSGDSSSSPPDESGQSSVGGGYTPCKQKDYHIENQKPSLPAQQIGSERTDVEEMVPFIDPIKTLVCDSGGREFTNHDHDITLKVPPGAIRDGVTIRIEVGVALHGPFQFPPGTRPISPIVWFCMQKDIPFLKPVEVILPHFLHNWEGLQLGFLKADHSTFTTDNGEERYTFQTMNDPMEFYSEDGKGFGLLSTKHFCFLCIQSNITCDQLSSKAEYCLTEMILDPWPSMPKKVLLHFCVTFNMETCLKTVKSQFPSCEYSSRSFTFQTTGSEPKLHIKVDEPQCGWTLALRRGKVIKAADVDYRKFKPPDLKWMEEEKMYPPRLTIEAGGTSATESCVARVRFEGTCNDEELYTEVSLPLNLQPSALQVSPTQSLSAISNGHAPSVGGGYTPWKEKDYHIEDQRPSLLVLLKFPMERGNISIPQQIGSIYSDFGTFLLNDETGAIVTGIAQGNSDTINKEILKKWLQGRGRQPVTWRTLIEVLRDSQLTILANDIERNLSRL